jgi:NAD dependent epimerase/dehydratase family enzyme
MTNAGFTDTLARVLRRPAFMRVPAWAMKRAAGQLAEEVILVSQRVKPARLDEAGVTLDFTGLEQTLRLELGRFGSEQPGANTRPAAQRHVA